MALFIREEFRHQELRYDAKDAGHTDRTDLLVWSPVSCRHTSWTFKPLCRCDERGRIIKGSRQRCPFIKGA